MKAFVPYFMFVLAPLYLFTQTTDEDKLIKSVFFGGGSYYMDDQQKAELLIFLDKVDNIQNYEVILSGHTDNIGGKEYNEWLSEMRIHAVKVFLVASDVPEDIIHLKKFGQDHPLYSNESQLGRKANRRVDVILIPVTF